MKRNKKGQFVKGKINDKKELERLKKIGFKKNDPIFKLHPEKYQGKKFEKGHKTNVGRKRNFTKKHRENISKARNNGGYISGDGYKIISILGIKMPEHHLVWLRHNQLHRIPKGCVIHHCDGNKLNNDISNLQLMTRGFHIKLHNASRKI